MSQSDFDIANAAGAVFRADINAAFDAIAENSAGATEPTVKFANMWWFDDTTDILKQRNKANTAWVLVAKKDGTGWTPYIQEVLMGTTSALDKLGLELVSQAEAEAGSGTTARRWTAQRVAQAIDALAPAPEASDIPIGTVTDYAGASEPSGWLFCYGQAISRTTYAALFAAIGTTYGAGNGSTTFNLPDLRGRVVAGQDDMGGTSANRLTGQSGGLNGDTLGASGGAETHQLTEAQMPVHSHSTTAHGFQAGPQQVHGSATGPGVTPSGTTSGSAGSGEAHNNVQPTITLNKIIYTGV